MKIELNAKKLRVAIGNLCQVVNASTVLPILESILVTVRDKKITFMASDLESVIEYSEDSACTGSVEFCIGAKDFLFFLKNSIDDNCTIDVTEKIIKLSCGDFVVKFANNESPLNMPKVPVIDGDSKLNVKYDVLASKMLPAVRFVSKDYLRPAMTGVYFYKKDKQLKIAATDAHSLYYEDVIPFEKNIDSFILPHKSSLLFLSNFKGHDVSIFQDGNHIKFKNENVILTCRKIDSKYPEINAVISKYDLNFYVKRKQFISFLKLAIQYTNKSTNQIEFKVVKDKIMANGGDTDFGFGFEYNLPIYNPSVPIDVFSFAFNLKFVLKCLDLSKDEYVKINHSATATKSFTIDDRFLLMPLMMHN